MKKQFPELPGWQFTLEEASASVYEVVGEDRFGRRVSAKGINPDALFLQCFSDALQIVGAGQKTTPAPPSC
jgi:hypothetical protein